MPDDSGHYILFVTVHQKISYLNFIFCNYLGNLSNVQITFILWIGEGPGEDKPFLFPPLWVLYLSCHSVAKIAPKQTSLLQVFWRYYVYTYLFAEKSRTTTLISRTTRDNATFLFNVGARLTAGIFSVYS